LVNGDQARLGQVGDEDAGHAQRDGQQRRDLGDRLDLPAEQDDPLVLGQQPARAVGRGGGGDQRLERELVARPRTAPGHGVRPHERLLRLAPARCRAS
jgi:hypothetical protein